MSKTAVRLRGLRHAWPGQAPLLDIPELDLPLGQTLFVQGQSGCGKSTLLSLLCGVLPLQQGSCQVLGEDLVAMTASQRDRFRGEHLGLIFQQFNLLPYLDVASNVILPTRLFASRARRSVALWGSVQAHAQHLCESLGLTAVHWRLPVHRLSVGQQQRVAAARALMGCPQLIVADEPTSALDEANKEEFIQLLLRTAQQHDASVIVVSHDARLAERFDRVHTMHTAGGAHALA